MDELEFGELMIERVKVARRAAELDEKIKAHVLEIGETQKLAGVTASYYKPGRTTPDYAAMAGDAVPQPDDYKFVIEDHSTVKTTTSWKAVCDTLGVFDVKSARYMASDERDTYSETKPARVAIKVKL